MRAVSRLALIVALGLAVSGCDKCGNWFKYTPKACGTETAPQ
ncbi:hypothetical protein [Aquabacter spiritensis]|uniref:Peptidylprolyl isomerase n=1 Tax=Aquabacter spiritensis TaxID=933073 RepID=A0A4R3LPB7_9HYPH|nr:hypothetical protein [Aquabacter spiritensis]TCT02230.1 hypothetical protein EDC64_11491 [Aquabacter spiritensis]